MGVRRGDFWRLPLCPRHKTALTRVLRLGCPLDVSPPSPPLGSQPRLPALWHSWLPPLTLAEQLQAPPLLAHLQA